MRTPASGTADEAGLPATSAGAARATPSLEPTSAAGAPIVEDVAHHVLVVEDDTGIALPLTRMLEREGHVVAHVTSGAAALDHVAAEPVSLVVLDLGLPDMDGLDVCRQLRADGFVGGIIVVTARGSELDRVVGLDVGADDYLPKPFAVAELLARIRALLRRSARTAADATADGLRVDADARRAWLGPTELALTPKEFDVLRLLDDHRGAVVTREDLMSQVWDEHWFGSTKTLDVTVGRLRGKLQDADPGNAVAVVTVRGVGFRLETAD